MIFVYLWTKFDFVNPDRSKFEINNKFDQDKAVDQVFQVMRV
jgi:hypothetical protein